MTTLFGTIGFKLYQLSIEKFAILFGIFVFVDGVTLLFIGRINRIKMLQAAGLSGMLMSIYIQLYSNTVLGLLAEIMIFWTILNGLSEDVMIQKIKPASGGRIHWTLVLVFSLCATLILVYWCLDPIFLIWVTLSYEIALGITTIFLPLRLANTWRHR